MAAIRAPREIVYTSRRGHLDLTWTIVLTGEPPGRTRVHLRLRRGGVKRTRLVTTVGELIDLLTIAGLAAGLDERLAAG